MTITSISEAKKTYIETGRLNRNVVSKEVSISWYKCKLQNLIPNMPYRSCGHKPDKFFEDQFTRYIDSIVPEAYQYVLTNSRLEKVSSRLSDQDLESIDTIDDLYIGTNGGYIAYKIGQTYTVHEDEHYLDFFNQYATTGILVKKESQVLGVLMLISEDVPTPYVLNNLSLKINTYNEKSYEMIKEDHSTNRTLSDFIIYPDAYLTTFKNQIEKLEERTYPILIEGNIGAGKTALAWYLALKTGVPITLPLEELPQSIHKQLIESALYQNETVIIENLHATNDESIGLLTAYTEEKLKDKNNSNSFKFKCNQLILTTVNSNRDIIKYSQCWQKLYNRLNHRRVAMLNLVDFTSDLPTILDKFIQRTSVRATDTYMEKLAYMIRGKSFADLNEVIKESLQFVENQLSPVLDYLPNRERTKLQSLEEIEKAYVLKVYYLMDQNVTATAEILNIGRATLYRKLEKYQNDTI